MCGEDIQRKIIREFRTRFPCVRPRWHVSAPGRINLIGGHTDYNGFPVLPIALDRTIHIAATPADSRVVEIKNTEPDRCGDRRFDASGQIEPYPPGDWGNYAKAAVQSLALLWREQGKDPAGLRGMRCMVGGTLPAGGGLASSSALLVASALAFAACNEWLELISTSNARASLAERMARAERYVGTQGGGMDQAACLLARGCHALRIDFFPLRVQPLAFPDGYVVVAAHSTVRAEKARAQRLAYNRRVLECGIGKNLLARRLRMPEAMRLADLCRGEGAVELTRMTGLLSELLHKLPLVFLFQQRHVATHPITHRIQQPKQVEGTAPRSA